MIIEHQAEVIGIIERFSFNLGRTIECITRADRIRGANIVADLEQAQWHLEREIKRLKQSREETASANRPTSLVYQLGRSQQKDGFTWQDRMGDRYRFCAGRWEYQTEGQNTWEPVRFDEILTEFGPYTLVEDGRAASTTETALSP
jgi:hypothetical protein